MAKKRRPQIINGHEQELPAFTEFQQDHPDFIYELITALHRDLAASEKKPACSCLEESGRGKVIHWRKLGNQ